MENERYGVELTLNTSQYLTPLQKVIAETEELKAVVEETKKALKTAVPGTSFHDVLVKDLAESTERMQELKNEMKDVGKEVQISFGTRFANFIKNGLKSLAKFSLALIGVRSAYMLLRKAMSSLQETNAQLKTDLDYINYSLGQSLEPVIMAIVDAIYWLMGVLGSIIKLVTGINIYAKATSDNFKKANKNANELKKTLAGFDTIMNLQQQTGTGVGTITPSVDLSKVVETGEATSWLEFKWTSTKLLLLDIFTDIKTALNGLKAAFIVVGTILGEIVDGIVFTIIGLFKAVGNLLGTIVDGVVDTIKTLFSGLYNSVKQIWDGIKKIFTGDIKEGFTNIGKGIANVFITILNGVISAINTLWKGLLSIVDSIGSAFGKTWNLKTKLSIPKIPYLNVGTNYVPQDTLAVVHKGEMIVPKKYNPMTSGIGGTNEETNELLRQLNTTLEQKEFNGYISANDITNTAINGINQQSRIMGRSVIR